MYTFILDGKTFEIEYIHRFQNGGIAKIQGLDLNALSAEADLDIGCGLIDIVNPNSSITNSISRLESVNGLDFTFAVTEASK